MLNYIQNKKDMPIKDKSRYPANWKQIRMQILERANNRCEFCGVENHSIVYRQVKDRLGWDDPKRVKIVLTIAHLDHTPENCDPSNLRALCQRCHLRYDAKHHAESARRTRMGKKYKNQLKLEL